MSRVCIVPSYTLRRPLTYAQWRLTETDNVFASVLHGLMQCCWFRILLFEPAGERGYDVLYVGPPIDDDITSPYIIRLADLSAYMQQYPTSEGNYMVDDWPQIIYTNVNGIANIIQQHVVGRLMSVSNIRCDWRSTLGSVHESLGLMQLGPSANSHAGVPQPIIRGDMDDGLGGIVTMLDDDVMSTINAEELCRTIYEIVARYYSRNTIRASIKYASHVNIDAQRFGMRRLVPSLKTLASMSALNNVPGTNMRLIIRRTQLDIMGAHLHSWVYCTPSRTSARMRTVPFAFHITSPGTTSYFEICTKNRASQNQSPHAILDMPVQCVLDLLLDKHGEYCNIGRRRLMRILAITNTLSVSSMLTIYITGSLPHVAYALCETWVFF